MRTMKMFQKKKFSFHNSMAPFFIRLIRKVNGRGRRTFSLTDTFPLLYLPNRKFISEMNSCTSILQKFIFHWLSFCSRGELTMWCIFFLTLLPYANVDFYLKEKKLKSFCCCVNSVNDSQDWSFRLTINAFVMDFMDYSY